MAKRFVKSKLYNTWNGKTTTEKANYKDSVIFVEDRKVIIEGNADGDGFVEFDGRTPVAGEGIVISELASAQGPYVGLWEIEHASPLIGSDLTLTSGSKLTPAHSETFDVVTGITKDKFGHITGATKLTVQLPASGNVTSTLVVANSSNGTSSATTATTNTTTYLNHVEGGSVNADIQVKGSDEVSVSAVNDVLTIKHLTPAGGAAVTATSAPAFTTDNNTFTAITGLSKNANGHITAVEAKTFTLPENAFKDTDTKVTSVDNHYTPTANTNSEITATTSGNTTVEDGGLVITGFKLQRDAAGHVTGATATTKKIDYPTLPTVNDGVLTIQANGVSKGTFSANQSTNETINITASDLGLTQAMKYIGKTTTQLSDGSTTKTITINSKLVDVTQGNVVIDSSDKKEYIWNGLNWEEFGNEGNYKVIQTAVSDPTASGNTLNFIASISQDTNGVITPTKSTVPTAGTSLGVVKTTSTVNTIDGLTPSPIVNGVVYYKDTNTAHSHSAGVGLVIDGTGGTDGTVTYKTKLKSETAHTASSATPTNTSNRQYAVGVDKDGYLSVNVPWKNDDTTYSAGTGLTLNGTTFNHSNSIAAGTAQGGSGTLTHGGTFTVPTVTYDAQGHITSTSTTTYTLPSDNNTDTKVKNTSSTSKVFILGQSAQGGDAAEAYTNASVYMQSGKLYSEGYEVINSSDWEWEVLA